MESKIGTKGCDVDRELYTNEYIRKFLIYFTLFSGGILMITPFLFMVFSSVKTDAEILAYPPTFIPNEWDLSHYVKVWNENNLDRAFLNTLFVSAARTVLVVSTSACAAYAFAMLRFPGRKLIFILFLTTLMLPGQVTLIPVYVIIRRMPLIGGNDIMGMGGQGLINTHAGMIVPGLAAATGVFLLRQFMTTIPRDLLDAARIDGASEFGAFYKIVLPLIIPALAALGIFSFQSTWNDFLWPLLVGQRKELWTLQVQIAQMQRGLDGGSVTWQEIMAAIVIATMPILIVFVFAQRYFIRGIALSGVKQ